MLTRLVVKGFRSIRELDLPLSPLTALVGPNGSGKSTVMAAFGGIWNAQTPTWRHKGGPIDIQRIPSALSRAHVMHLQLDLAALRNESTVRRASELSSNGDNISNLISSFSRDQQSRLAQDLAARVPGVRDLDVVPTSDGKHRLRFYDRWSDSEFTPHEISDGTLMMLAFLALKFQPTRPDVITIEEPERGLHPYLLGELVRFLRELTQGPNPIQVVLATHSAELLEHLKPEEVRFLSRSPDDGNVVVRMVDPNDSDWPRYFREFNDSLGSAWLSGGLGGTPQAH